VERPSLYVVATPIGNLADITLRALECSNASLRSPRGHPHHGAVLRHYGVSAPLIALHEHNERRAAQKICSCWRKAVGRAGKRCRHPGDFGPRRHRGRAGAGAGYPVVPVPAPMPRWRRCPQPAVRRRIFCSMVSCRRRRRRAGANWLPSRLPVSAGVLRGAPPRYRKRCRYGRGFGAGARSRSRASLQVVREHPYVQSRYCGGMARRGCQSHQGRIRAAGRRRAGGGRNDARAAHGALEILLRELPLKQAVKLAAQIGGGSRNELYRLALEMKRQ